MTPRKNKKDSIPTGDRYQKLSLSIEVLKARNIGIPQRIQTTEIIMIWQSCCTITFLQQLLRTIRSSQKKFCQKLSQSAQSCRTRSSRVAEPLANGGFSHTSR